MIFKSPYPDIKIPETSLSEIVFTHCDRLKDKPAFIDAVSGRKLTFGEVKQLAHHVAAGLAQRGLQKGDVVAIYLPNLPEYPPIFQGIALAGGVVTTANPLYSADELGRQLKATSTKFLLTIPPLMGKAAAAASHAGVKEIFTVGAPAPGATAFSELIKNDGKPLKVKINPKEDLVALPYSSGTTGLPKAVMLTHYNLVANLSQCKEMDAFEEGHTVFSILPFFHIYGMTCLVNATMYAGSTVVTMPQYEPEAFLRALQDYKIDTTYVAPPLVLMLAKHPLVERFDLSNLKNVISGAAPMDGALAKACADRIGAVVCQGYGMTEASPVTHGNYIDPEKCRPNTVGVAIANTECRIVDVATGKDLGPNEEGEILIRGPQIMKGYLNDEAATAQTVDKDGWLHTGDIGIIDDEGRYRVYDRVKELIKYKGFQVPPAELEGILLTHPAVADAAVIPAPDVESGEVPVAFVVTRAPVTETALCEFVAERVSPYKKIRAVNFIEAIPKSAAGKILRRELKAKLKQAVEEKSKSGRLEDRVTLEKRGHILLIGLDRPNKLNAFDIAMLSGLAKALTQAEDDPDVRCSLIFAHGTAFTSGLDLADVAPMVARGEGAFSNDLVDPWQMSAGRMRTKPLLVAVHGRCWTLGIELALAADVVVAAADTRFSQMEVQRGIFPFGGATVRFPKVAGWGNAMRYLLTGDEFTAEDALRMNIVQEVVTSAKVLDKTIEIANRIAEQAPLAVQAVIASARKAERDGLEAARKDLLPMIQKLMSSEDSKEGLRSFLEKRTANFVGR
jgi:acyl-CoA synthetase (AMP-forming)/AMP-acid ligase II/enoyl-CoA hydratase/carnithine racemase